MMMIGMLSILFLLLGLEVGFLPETTVALSRPH